MKLSGLNCGLICIVCLKGFSSAASTSNTQSSAEPSDLSSNTPTTASVKKPNILVILADDVGTGDIPLYWNSGLVDMPNVQRLANMGVTFKDAHSTPLCAPSRYMLLSGNYPHRGHLLGGTWGLTEKSISSCRTKGV